MLADLTSLQRPVGPGAVLRAWTRSSRPFRVGTATLAGLSACGSRNGDGASKGGGPWAFTDDLGRTVHLDHAPRRIAVLNDPLAATLWSQGLHGIVATQNTNDDIYDAAGVPEATRTSFVTLGQDTRLEALAAAKPDLIIDNAARAQDSTIHEKPQIADIAPWIAINGQSASFEAIMGSGARLLSSLGITETDLAAKADYERQATRLKQALAAKPGLRIGVFLGAESSDIYLMGAGQWPALLTLKALGADLAPISGDNEYYQTISWENVGALPLDLVIDTDAKEGVTPSPTALPWREATWRQMPAIKAGQYLTTGDALFAYNYATFARLLGELITVVERSKPGIGPR